MDMALEVERTPQQKQQQSRDHLEQWARQRTSRGPGGAAAAVELLPEALRGAGNAPMGGGAANPTARRPRCVDDDGDRPRPQQQQQPASPKAGRDATETSKTQAETMQNRISTYSPVIPRRHSSAPPPARLHDETHHGRPRRPLPGRPTAAATGTTAISKPSRSMGTPSPPLPRRAASSAPSFMPIAALLNPHTGGVKRRRSRLDVDGPNTAGLSSKKRRLRRDLVTSRLSRPYSEPASHVHCRYGSMRRVATTAVANRALVGGGLQQQQQTGGGGGAATTQAKKGGGGNADAPMASLPSTSTFLRYSIMNRMRKRLGLRGSGVLRVGKAEAAQGGMGGLAQSSWHPDKTRPSSGPKLTAQGPSSVGAASPPGPAPLRRAVTKRAELPHPGHSSRAPTKLRMLLPQPQSPPPSGSPQRQLPPLKMFPRDKDAEPFPRSATEPRRSPLPPLSPRKQHVAEEAAGGADSFGFLHSDEGATDDGLAEEPDDVYCDFGILFGRTAEGLSPEGADRLAERGLDPNDDLAWLLT
ncbi:hypothetical protein JDV02_008761 [Purpureocillium takamizusanense]|uniref:Uncharacterized protein n=1 Tax=Purpureocillium takamizusanense TaxID=2060973 RepID=A0A9Q8QPD3_9HYPO|nr:uncharacterized protein JDV02_008761 [Purpureocillium takamizusanense]UNI22917.1 hypothetical protein JDV02_008761 [Purpureocillium takamizusanense]